jgi:Tol biopolymer transport system component/DNA-binding winged helix-turn-helix (wHTH) protein
MPACIYEFGPFQLDTGAYRLLKENTPVSLAPKSFDLLQVLIQNQGRALSKSELLEELWPDTQVEEGNLTFQVSVLRKALGPEAGSWIETVPRHGYRFSAPVIVHPVADVPTSASVANISPQGEIETRIEAPSVPPPEYWTRAVLSIIALALAALAAVLFLPPRNRTPAAVPTMPLTSFPGSESNPTLSPDGRYVAFTWNGDKEDNFDIYIMAIDSGPRLRITTDTATDLSPAWSPDGSTIAFLRRFDEKRAELLLVPSREGPEHKIAETRNEDLRSPPLGLRVSSIAWSADGRWVAASHREPADSSDRIYLFSLTGEKRPLTAPPSDSQGDYMPAFSPSGRVLAFCRRQGFSTSEVYLLPIDTNLQPVGRERNLTSHKRWSVNPVWTHDGRGILYLFSEVPAALRRRELRLADATRDPPTERTIPFDDRIYQLDLGHHLVYTQVDVEIDIWRAPILTPRKPPGVPERFLSSTRPDSGPRFSPDGRKISFISGRSGSNEIWIANADGSNASRMTSLGSPGLGSPAWSPDGQWLAFHSRPEGQSDLFVIPAAGGAPKRLTSTAFDEIDPGYSRDGRWIYFGSFRSGQWQIWKIPAAGGEGVQVTNGGGMRPLVSPDGKMIYYLANSGDAIWQVPVAGGAETQVLAPVHKSLRGFDVTKEGIYYTAPPHSRDQCYIEFFSFSNRQSKPVLQIMDRPFGIVVSVSPDRKYLVFHQTEKIGFDLMLVISSPGRRLVLQNRQGTGSTLLTAYPEESIEHFNGKVSGLGAGQKGTAGIVGRPL